jgi:uncharacterized membrane protein YeaQ/YmgE (transglycosylase-associated protein family)
MKIDVGGHGPKPPVVTDRPETERLALDAASTMPPSRHGGMTAFCRSRATDRARAHCSSRALSLLEGEHLMGLGIIGWIVIGILAGWLAEQVMGRSHGLLTNLIVGVVGALLGGFIAGSLLGIPVGGFNLVTLLVAFLGACVLLFLVGLVKRRA